MFVEQYWQKSQNAFKSFVPGNIGNSRPQWFKGLDDSCSEPAIAAGSGLDLSLFCHRFEAGDICLREGRQVSRSRIALVCSGVPRQDALAVKLARQMKGYYQASKLLQHNLEKDRQLTMDVLLQIHALINREHNKAGKIRAGQNWVGGSSPIDARFVPPPADMLDELMQDWLAYVNDDKSPVIEKALTAYSQFIVLHPFDDGNGRLSRLILNVMLGAQSNRVSPFLYRLAHGEKGYLDTIEGMLDNDWQGARNYWQKALCWSAATTELFHTKANNVHQQMLSSLLMYVINSDTYRFIEMLWHQPIVTVEYAQRKLALNKSQVLNQLGLLAKVGIVQRHTLKQPMNTVIYDCPAILQCWHEMDNWLFTTSE